MKRLTIRELTEDERQGLKAGLKAREGFTVRRSQIVLLSAEDQLSPAVIGARVGCTREAVRKVLHAFEREGVACLQPKSRARHDDQRAFTDTAQEQLREVVHQSPRQHGYEVSYWTLAMLAEVSYQRGWVAQPVHPDTVGATLHRMGFGWKRAKRWISSPDPQYAVKKNDVTG